MAVIKSIIAAGGGDFTTIQAFFDWVWATYAGNPFTEAVIGQIQDSATYTENVLPNAGIRPSVIFPMVLTSNQNDKASFPVINGSASYCVKWIPAIAGETLPLFLISNLTLRGTGQGVRYDLGGSTCHMRTWNCWFDGLTYGWYITTRGARPFAYSSLFTNCTYGIYASFTDAVYPAILESYGNTFYNCTYAVYGYTNQATQVTIRAYNNIMYIPNGGYGLYTSANNIGNSIIDANNNCYYRNGTSYCGRRYTTNYAAITDLQALGLESVGIAADPVFVDVGAGDFRLQDGSSCISAGTPSYLFFGYLGLQKDLYSADYDGVAPSMGCHQNLSVLTPAKSVNLYPLGKTTNTAPYFCWKVGTRDTGGYGADAGTAQYRLAIVDWDITALLNGVINSSASTIIYDNLSGVLPDSGYIIIDNEIIFYGSKDADELFDCVRGACGTIAAAHADNARFRVIEAIKDSWLAGTFYDGDYTWEYSSNYTPGEDPALYGDWSSMGTGSPSTTGVEGTNGVLVSSSVTRYCRVDLSDLLSQETRYRVVPIAFNGATI